MALNITNNVPRNTGNKKSQKPNYKVIFVVVVAVLVFIVGMVIANINASNSNVNPYESNSVLTVPTEDASDSLFQEDTNTDIDEINNSTQPIDFVDNGAQIAEVSIPDTSIYHRQNNVFSFDQNIQYSGATAIAEDNEVMLGEELTFTPTKTTTLHFEGNRLDIAHTSGATVSIMRSACYDEIALDDLDAELQQNILAGKAEAITSQTVYYGSSIIGRAATGVIEVDKSKHTILMAYFCKDNIFYTLVGLAEEGTEDFLELLLNNVKLNGYAISIE